MDSWLGLIWAGVIGFAAWAGYAHSRRIAKERDKIRRIFAHVYEFRECAVLAAQIDNKYDEILRSKPWIEGADLRALQAQNVRCAAALAIATKLQIESAYEFIAHRSGHSGLQKDDETVVQELLGRLFGDGWKHSWPMDPDPMLLAGVAEVVNVQKDRAGTSA
jgi:hypothetical protein